MAQRVYWPQLDGVRALAIAAVVAYHLGYAPGGWVGVDAFFVLSGYLITTILLPHVDKAGGLRTFWGHRARRLLPAVLTLLVVLSAYAWAEGPDLVPAQLRDPALATLFYGANWQEISARHSYFAAFTGISPLEHTWSLAIEEQYYLVWPIVLGLLFLATKSASEARRRKVLIGVTLTLAVASAVWMGVAAHLYGSNRAYLGTDTRAWELLAGGAAAMLWPAVRVRPAPGEAPAGETVVGEAGAGVRLVGAEGEAVGGGGAGRGIRVWSVLAVLGLVGAVVGMTQAGGPPAWIWDGGLVAISLCALAVVVGSVRAPDGPVANLLAIRPLRWLGLISYSLYIWHWPVIVLMNEDSTGLSGAELLAARLGTMLFASCCSYYLIEAPLRRADWASLSTRLRLPAISFATSGIAAVAVVVVVGTVGPPAASSGALPASVSNSRPAATGGTVAPSAGARPAPVRLDIPTATPANPYRVWIIGDSVMADASPGVIAALQSTHDVSVVVNSAFPGWGLTTDHNWPEDGEQTIATYHPQIVIGTWSWDDGEASTDPVAYLARLEAAMRVMLRPGDGVDAVVLLQFPQAGPAIEVTDPATREADWVKETTIQEDWDRLAQQAVGAFPGHALYLATSQLFAPGGRFYTWFQSPTGQWIRARKLDNTHFCPYGAAAFGALITQDLTGVLHLPAMTPGWETAAWTHDARYNDPPGACPDDQPPAGYRGLAVPG